MDTLTIHDISLSTKIGTHDWEQQIMQVLKLDLCMQVDALKIAENDAIEYAINYDLIIEHVLTFAKEQHFQLIETFAERLVHSLFSQFATNWIKVTVHKPAAVLVAKDVTITLERTRA